MPLRTERLAFLVACASALQLLESQLPQPLPGVRLGLANVLTLVALFDLGFAAAVQVAVLRTILSSLVLGTFLTPTLLLSLSGALASSLIMGGLFHVLVRLRRPPLSLVGVSLLGALAHILVQFLLVYLLLVRHVGLFVFLPWLVAGGIATGWVSGLLAMGTCRKLVAVRGGGGASASPVGVARAAEPARPGGRRSAVGLKIVFFLILGVLLLIVERIPLLLALLAVLLLLSALAVDALHHWWGLVCRLRVFLAVCLLFPLLLVRTGLVWLELGPLVVASDGVAEGARLLIRLLSMMLGASLVVVGSPREELAAGLAPLLSPLRAVGLSGREAAGVLVRALVLLPELSSQLAALLRRETRTLRGMRSLLPSLASALMRLYTRSDPGEATT